VFHSETAAFFWLFVTGGAAPGLHKITGICVKWREPGRVEPVSLVLHSGTAITAL
jgi:hypothetical protein